MGMKRYANRKKVIEAWEWDGTQDMLREIEDAGANVVGVSCDPNDGSIFMIRILSHSKYYYVKIGDFVFRTTGGNDVSIPRFRSMKPEDFHHSYQLES